MKKKGINNLSNNELEALVSGIAHEVKLPIANIISSVNLLKRKLQNNVSEEDKIYFEIIYNNCNQILRHSEHTTKAIMFLRENESINLKRENINLCLLALCEGAKPFSLSNRVDINVFCECDETYAVINRELFSSAILNLISNAIKYTKEGNLITICLKKEDENIIITVEDKGIGIKPNDIEKIFEPFYTTQNSQSAISSTGLGLYIVKSIVNLHKGKIFAESEAGKGTKMTVIIPSNLKESNELFLGDSTLDSKEAYKKDLDILIARELSNL
jgi:signal transduction histidine kinase